MPLEYYKLTVKGRVQGVFFRSSAQKIARKLSIIGTVRNTVAGDVEIIAAGEQQAIHDFIQWCHRGSPSAKVTKVIAERAVASAEHTGFCVIK